MKAGWNLARERHGKEKMRGNGIILLKLLEIKSSLLYNSLIVNLFLIGGIFYCEKSF